MPPIKTAGKKPKLYAKPAIVKKGTVITDHRKFEFIVGKEIGSGGFGRIYDGITRNVNETIAIKMEPLGNGPLFTEMHVYLRILKLEQLEEWKQTHDVHFLGLPHFISSGKFVHDGNELRYLVIPKYNISLEALRLKKVKFTIHEVALMAKTILHSLAYLHDQKYTHGDVKAENLMLNDTNDLKHIFLIDFGLAQMVPKVVIEKEDKKRAHNGTAIFTSCDAHRGCLPTFRGDLEILTHNMLYWLTNSLPWKEFEQNCDHVFQAKHHLIYNAEKDLPKLLDNKVALNIIVKFYSISKRMEFSEKLDIAVLFSILETVNNLSPDETSPKKRREKPTSTQQTVDETSPKKRRAKKPLLGISNETQHLDEATSSNSVHNSNSDEIPIRSVQKIRRKRRVIPEKTLNAKYHENSPNSVKELHSKIPGTRNMKLLRKSIIGRALVKHKNE